MFFVLALYCAVLLIQRGVQDDILESESQPYTSLDTISSLLEASVNDMAHNSTSDGSSKRTTEPTKAVRDAGESSVTGLHVSSWSQFRIFSHIFTLRYYS